MLSHLLVKNFTIIETLSLDLQSGMTAITGETGAGKSIVMDALELVLGSRADSKVVRHNTPRCEITASFAIDNLPLAKQWLTSNELTLDNECIIRRIITEEGRSKAFINGIPCPLQLVRELGSQLVDIHGQHESHTLLKVEKQRELLDNFAQHPRLLEAVNTHFTQWSTTNKQLIQLEQKAGDGGARIELLSYHIDEFEKLALMPDEFESLEQEHKTLCNAQTLIEQSQTAWYALTENKSACASSHLHQALNAVQSLTKYTNQLSSVNELINNALIHTQEASDEIQSYLNDLDLNPNRLRDIEQRLQTIYDLSRKHRVKPEYLLEKYEQLKTEHDRLLNSEQTIMVLKEQMKQHQADYHTAAEKLSQSRQQAAKKLSKAVTDHIHQLGMPGGEYTIRLTPHEPPTPSAYGAEQIEFLVCANPGQSMQPLKKVASGGELSRISLAIQVIAAQRDNTPTLVFDEVDVGIGGGTAEIVGQLLSRLGQSTQVFCITHQPQVASQAQQHLLVKKSILEDSTQTQIILMDYEQRKQEIARMLGGVKITAQTLAHAEEMLGV